MPALRRRAMMMFSTLALALWGTICFAVEYPGPAPGVATAAVEANVLRLENDVLAVEWQSTDGHLRPHDVEDKQSKIKTPPGGELFELVLADGKTIRASELTIAGRLVCEDVAADADALRAGDRFAGKRIVATLTDKDGALLVRWQAVLRNGANYVRQQIIIEPQGWDLLLQEIVSLALPGPGAKCIGEVLGSPVTVGNLFFACESPLADNQGADGRVRCRLTGRRPVKAGKSASCWSVVGVVPPGQMRRAFLCYVERRRPRPYRPFLHYNCYYDISWACRKFDEKESVAAIREFGRELAEKRNVKLDAFVFDNGWDDPQTLWGFHEGFPNGFAPLRDAAAKYRSAVGVWLSPCGGGGPLGVARREYGRKQGFELNAHGLSPAGPKYFARFRWVCLDMIEKIGVNHFKFDDFGIGNTAVGATYRRPSSEEVADIEAVMRLIADLRKAQPGVYINTTVGTWPSPFWLWHSDSIWRNGCDMGFLGEGTMRQQWLNYRDAVVRQMIARRGPLYPLNSLMTQGITYARRGKATRMTNDLNDLKDEFRMFFASGTQLQELYITPQMMTPEMWDVLAEAAKWSRENADVLVDTHMIGGSVIKGHVYGYASWSPRKGIVALRNPSGKSASFVLDLDAAWELPPDAPRQYLLKSPWKEDVAQTAIPVSADRGLQFEMQPFEVLVLESVATE
ncbi:MAG: hypothetical protein K8R46_02280 [Pirellulales bacterium]|nr:hypothetical protein [Pirellulales bacterium]